MFAIAVIVLLGIIAFAVAPDLMALLTGIGCFLLILAAGILAVLVILVLTGVIQ